MENDLEIEFLFLKKLFQSEEEHYSLQTLRVFWLLGWLAVVLSDILTNLSCSYEMFMICQLSLLFIWH